MSRTPSDHEAAPLSGEDRQLLAAVGVSLTVSKPLSVWIAQILLALNALGSAYGAVRAFPSNPVGALIALGVAGLLTCLVVTAQLRRGWARWVLGGAIGLFCTASLVQHCATTLGTRAPSPHAIAVRPEERSGAAVGGVLFALTLFVVSMRITFGEPSKRYFDSSRGSPPSL